MVRVGWSMMEEKERGRGWPNAEGKRSWWCAGSSVCEVIERRRAEDGSATSMVRVRGGHQGKADDRVAFFTSGISSTDGDGMEGRQRGERGGQFAREDGREGEGDGREEKFSVDPPLSHGTVFMRVWAMGSDGGCDGHGYSGPEWVVGGRRWSGQRKQAVVCGHCDGGWVLAKEDDGRGGVSRWRAAVGRAMVGGATGIRGGDGGRWWIKGEDRGRGRWRWVEAGRLWWKGLGFIAVWSQTSHGEKPGKQREEKNLAKRRKKRRKKGEEGERRGREEDTRRIGEKKRN